MQHSNEKQSVLVITGMHRSGTSLTASLLQSAGVDIGQRLMGASESNVKGHFEELDFVDFHESVLRSQGISIEGWTLEGKLSVQEQYLGRAKSIIQKNLEKPLWGWKDPRTTLFLDFWINLIPEAKFVFVYRSPWEVVDSLYRRGDDVFQNNPNFAVKIWLHYNELIINFYDRFPERCVLLHLSQVARNPANLLEAVGTKFGIQLSSVANLYEDSLLNRDISTSHHPTLIRQYFPEALDLHHELGVRASLTNDFSPLTDEVIQFPPYQAWVLQDWLDLRRAQRELKQLKKQHRQTLVELEQSHSRLHENQVELERSHSQLHETQAELERSHSQLHEAQAELAHLRPELHHTQAESERSHSQLHETQAELAHLRSELHHTQAESERSHSQLQETQAELAQLQSQLHETQTELERSHLWQAQVIQDFQNTITAMESSKFWKFRSRWFQIRDFLGVAEAVSLQSSYFSSKVKGLFTTSTVEEPVPLAAESSQPTAGLTEVEAQQEISPTEGSSYQNLLGIPRTEDINYQKWLNQNYPREADLRKMADTVPILGYKPVFSVVMPVFNTPEPFLQEAIESVINQVYPYWELCIADDASTQPHIKSILESYTVKDSRIKVVFREENGHISQASNSALEIASGEFVALLDHDDLLAPDALYEVAVLLNKHPDADMIYSDEDKIQADNTHKDPYFKPDWCPDSFLSRMYTCHLGTYRRMLITEIGGFRVGYEGSQDYDLVLRLTEKTDKIFHIPKILYHWRIHSESAASGSEAKPYAYQVAKKALTDAIGRRGEKGYVVDVPNFTGYYIIRYEIANPKLVSILIPTRNLGKILDKCLESIFTKVDYKNYEVIVIDNGSTEEETVQVIAKWIAKEPTRFQCYPLDIPFNFSKINNYGVTKAKGDYLLFLNNDTEVISSDWLTAMVEQAQRPAIGAVGALLLYPDDTVQHAGVVVGMGGVANHSHLHYSHNAAGYFNQIQTVNNYSAVTGACLMCRREVFDAVGGFEEELSVAFNDIDLCLKIGAQGYRNIYLPHVVLYHYESKSRGYDDTPEKRTRFIHEVTYMQRKWKDIIEHDPCYNPHLERSSQGYSIRT